MPSTQFAVCELGLTRLEGHLPISAAVSLHCAVPCAYSQCSFWVIPSLRSWLHHFSPRKNDSIFTTGRSFTRRCWGEGVWGGYSQPQMLALCLVDFFHETHFPLWKIRKRWHTCKHKVEPKRARLSYYSATPVKFLFKITLNAQCACCQCTHCYMFYRNMSVV